MKDIVLLFNTACVYEIVTLNYFLNFTGSETMFCSLDGEKITSMEGYRVEVDAKLSDIDIENVRCVIVPGGDVSSIKNEQVFEFLRQARAMGKIIGGICAGVDVLDEAGVLKGIQSTHSTELDYVCDDHVVTARANAYTDFAIEMGKELQLFVDEADLQETIDFWKYGKRMQ